MPHVYGRTCDLGIGGEVPVGPYLLVQDEINQLIFNWGWKRQTQPEEPQQLSHCVGAAHHVPSGRWGGFTCWPDPGTAQP